MIKDKLQKYTLLTKEINVYESMIEYYGCPRNLPVKSFGARIWTTAIYNPLKCTKELDLLTVNRKILDVAIEWHLGS